MSETKLEPTEQELYRQVRAGHIENGEVSSLAFTPMKKDNGELSVDLQGLTTAEAACTAFKARGYDTVGAWAVTTKECSDLGLGALHQPKDTPPPPNESHGFVDFRGVNASQTKKRAGRLAEKANARKCRHAMPAAPAASCTSSHTSEPGDESAESAG